MPAVEDEQDFVRVRLNVGRKHGKKAAHIRELLAESFGLARKAVRDLTVGEASTRFRLGAMALARLEELIVGFELDGIPITVSRVEGSEEDDDAGASVRTEAASQADAAPAAEAAEAAASRAAPEITEAPEAPAADEPIAPTQPPAEPALAVPDPAPTDEAAPADAASEPEPIA